MQHSATPAPGPPPVSFLDFREREWSVVWTDSAVAHIKALFGVDFAQLVQSPGGPPDAIVTPRQRLIEVLYVLCEDQIVQRAMSPADFARAMGEDLALRKPGGESTYERAAWSVLKALGQFLPERRVGQVMKRREVRRKWVKLGS